MHADEVTKLCAELSLKEEEGPLMSLNTDLKDDGEKILAFRLVGEVLSNKLVNREVFISTILRIWRLVERADIEVIDGNVFFFTFKNVDDRHRVFYGGPWSFDNALLVLEYPTGKGDIKDMKFNKAAFWPWLRATSPDRSGQFRQKKEAAKDGIASPAYDVPGNQTNCGTMVRQLRAGEGEREMVLATNSERSEEVGAEQENINEAHDLGGGGGGGGGGGALTHGKIGIQLAKNLESENPDQNIKVRNSGKCEVNPTSNSTGPGQPDCPLP
ncbi:hypothetical protein Dsin_003457 [Dipteronia sinensis]|uniref:DUF4283 domain-containing protein n=1 Tax=Dipteronia sinensis TaxID=43782 RepID=A0AAE0EKD4_9ROSI|nr:hypothetical protein Dsin_003457 [Dipteronia sinensis]